MAANLLQVVAERLDRAKLREKRRGRLRADTGDTGDIVGGVPDERLVVGHEGGGEPEAYLDGGDIVFAQIGEAVVRPA